MTIFEIQKDLNTLYEALEANGGELTEELATALDITEANYNDKLEKYYNMIKLQQGELNLIKEEADKYKLYKKRVDSLKDRLSTAVTQSLKVFGTPTKTGGYEYKKPTFRFLVSPSATYDIDRELIEEIKAAYIEIVEDYMSNENFVLSDIDTYTLVKLVEERVNACREYKATNQDTGEVSEFYKVNITENDLRNIRFTMVTDFNLLDITREYNSNTILGSEMLTQLSSLECVTSKSEAKELFNQASSLATRTVNENLKIC